MFVQLQHTRNPKRSKSGYHRLIRTVFMVRSLWIPRETVSEIMDEVCMLVISMQNKFWFLDPWLRWVNQKRAVLVRDRTFRVLLWRCPIIHPTDVINPVLTCRSNVRQVGNHGASSVCRSRHQYLRVSPKVPHDYFEVG